MKRLAAAALGALGLAVILVGTFLPWLRSGASTRDSYQAGDVLERLRHVRGLLSGVITVWPYIGLLCAGVVILFAVGLPHAAAGLGLLTGAAAGAVSIWALGVHGARFVGPLSTGPIVTLAGAVLVFCASILLLLPRLVRQHRS